MRALIGAPTPRKTGLRGRESALAVACRPNGGHAADAPFCYRVWRFARRSTGKGEATIERFKGFIADTRGANMVEYIILVGVVAILAMAGFKYFGKNVNNTIGLQAHTVSEVQSQ